MNRWPKPVSDPRKLSLSWHSGAVLSPTLLAASCRRKPVEIRDTWTHGTCGWTWEKHLLQQHTATKAAARDNAAAGRAWEAVAVREAKSVLPCSGVPGSLLSSITPSGAAGGGRVTNGTTYCSHNIVQVRHSNQGEAIFCLQFLLILIGEGGKLGRIILNIIGCPNINLHRFGFPLLACKSLFPPHFLSCYCKISSYLWAGPFLQWFVMLISMTESKNTGWSLYLYCLWTWLQKEKLNQAKRYLPKYYVIISFWACAYYYSNECSNTLAKFKL